MEFKLYHMLDCLAKIKQPVRKWVMGVMLQEQLKQSNSNNFNQVKSLFIFHLSFVIYACDAKPYDQFLISVFGCGNREINC